MQKNLPHWQKARAAGAGNGSSVTDPLPLFRSYAEGEAHIAVTEKLFHQHNRARTKSTPYMDVASSLQVLESALEESNRILLRMRELAHQSASVGELERAALNTEFQGLIGELDAIAMRTDVIDAQRIVSRIES